MSDEEKKAIKDCDSIFICLDDAMSEDSANDYRKSYKILKNLIEKQSKEIEELKEKNKLLGVISLSFKEIQDRDKKWEDKIKAKIEEIKDGTFDAKIVLQSLLEKE